jgi:hypothetical protein
VPALSDGGSPFFDRSKTVVMTLNAGKVRYARLKGRDYIVAQGTSIVHGVLSGSKGPLYYPPVETHRAGPAWNGIPILLNHPLDPFGRSVSANTPGIRERQQIGFLANTQTNNGERLEHEYWFDVEQLEAADRRFGTNVTERLKWGIPIETSTGLYTDEMPARPGSRYRGKPFEFMAMNHRPDHMAILPTSVGACSINDGCGVLMGQFR